ncbi:hypothetical protein AB6A40_001157 [Gnathostoma spinigerum]|uniref:Glutathione peroxidase n=1 Tax=Gnathostoma spinigerum TaxID=75299 RepID=A0ABD6E3P8_9BILA
MLKVFLLCALFVWYCNCETFGPPVTDEASRWSLCRQSNQSIYDFQVQKLDGTFTNLQKYKGQLLLIINVATYCGK